MVRTSWSPDAEAFLLELWAEKLPELRSARRNAHIYQEMEEYFSTKPKKFSAAEIKIKIHNMTNRYKYEKKADGPSEWHLFDGVHAILGDSRIRKIEQFSEDSLHLESPSQSPYLVKNDSPPPMFRFEEVTEARGSPARSTSLRAGRRRRNDYLNTQLKETDDFIKEQFRNFNENDERLIKIEERRNEILERLVNSCENVERDIRAFLRK